MKNYSYRIYYEDTDAGGVVYYANYLKFFERARTDYLRDLGINQNKLLINEKIAFIVRECEVKYLKAAKLDDLINVETKICDLNNISVCFEQKITKNNITLTTLKVKIICINKDLEKIAKIPNNIYKILI